MGDLISREKAFEVLTEYYHHRTKRQHEALKEALDRVPDADTDLNLKGYIHLRKVYGKMSKAEVVARLDWIKGNLAWLGPDGTRQQIEMLISDILRNKVGEEK